MKTQNQTNDTTLVQNLGEIGRSMDTGKTPRQTPTLLTVKQFPQKHPAFTEGALRMYIFNENQNGIVAAGAVVRLGRKVLINEEKFFYWIEAKNQEAAK